MGGQYHNGFKEKCINTRNWVDSSKSRDYWRKTVNLALNLRVPEVTFVCVPLNKAALYATFQSTSSKRCHGNKNTNPVFIRNNWSEVPIDISEVFCERWIHSIQITNCCTSRGWQRSRIVSNSVLIWQETRWYTVSLQIPQIRGVAVISLYSSTEFDHWLLQCKA